MRRTIIPALLAVLAAACGGSNASSTSSSSSDLRELSEAEVLADVETLGAMIRTSYGPLDFKRDHVGFDLDHELDVARAQVRAGKTEGERVFALYQLTGHLKDLHVGLTAGLASDGAFSQTLPFTLVPVEDGKYAVLAVAASGTSALVPGDVVTSFDGTPVADLEKILATFSDFVIPTTTRERWASHLTNRRFWMPASLRPEGKTVKLGIERAGGTAAVVDVDWFRSQNLSATIASFMPEPTSAPAPGTPPALPISPQALEMQAAEASIMTAAAPNKAFPSAPFFYNPTVATTFGLTAVAPSVVPDGAAGLGAVKYAYNGKTLLLIRVPTFLPPDVDANLDWLRTLLAEAQQGSADDADIAKRPIDAVIIDETRNGGGDPSYAQGLASFFVTDPIPGESESFRADRKWLGYVNDSLTQDPSLSSAGKKFFAEELRSVETSLDDGATVTPIHRAPYVSLGTGITPGDEVYGPTLTAHPNGGWKGPLLVLTDGRSVSAADMFPMLIQNGGVGKTFGTQTAGGGGMVEVLATLTNTALSFSCTRGFFGAYPKDGGPFWYIENNGVKPDYAHPLTAADIRGQFVDYVKHFSEVASTLKR